MKDQRPKRPWMQPLPDYESAESIYKRIPRNSIGEAKLSPELVSVFEQLLLEGNTRANASKVIGLRGKTLAGWISQGKKDIEAGVESLEAKLVWVIDRCEGEAERKLAIHAMHAATSPSADGGLALKILERRNPDDWAPAVSDPGDSAGRFSGMQKAQMLEEAKRALGQFIGAPEPKQLYPGEIVVVPDETPPKE